MKSRARGRGLEAKWLNRKRKESGLGLHGYGERVGQAAGAGQALAVLPTTPINTVHCCPGWRRGQGSAGCGLNLPWVRLLLSPEERATGGMWPREGRGNIMNHVLLFPSFSSNILFEPHPPCNAIIPFLQMRKLRPMEVTCPRS